LFTDPRGDLVEGAAATGVGGVAIGPYFIQRTSVDSSLGTLNLGSADPYIAGMRQASGLGLRVTLKPIIDALSYPNHPAKDAYRAYLDPPDPATWFNDYWGRALQPYLEWCDTVTLYTETNTISAKYPQGWRDLVTKVRDTGFSGPIASDGGEGDLSLNTTRYFDALTWFGASFYPTIDSSSDDRAIADWNAVADRMAAAHAQTGLPIFMSEVGVFNLGEAETVRWIDTMGEVLGPKPWWAGFTWWRWTQDPSRPLPASMQAALRLVAKRWASPS
jgi:hypothetical protein